MENFAIVSSAGGIVGPLEESLALVVILVMVSYQDNLIMFLLFVLEMTNVW